MGLLKGQEDTLFEGSYNAIKEKIFNAMKTYNSVMNRTIFGNCTYPKAISLYDLLMHSSLSIDDIKFMIDNEFCIANTGEIYYNEMPINISSQDSGCYVPNMPKLSTFDFCYDFITNKYSIIRDDTIYFVPFNCFKKLLCCDIVLTNKLYNEYLEFIGMKNPVDTGTSVGTNNHGNSIYPKTTTPGLSNNFAWPSIYYDPTLLSSGGYSSCANNLSN